MEWFHYHQAEGEGCSGLTQPTEVQNTQEGTEGEGQATAPHKPNPRVAILEEVAPSWAGDRGSGKQVTRQPQAGDQKLTSQNVQKFLQIPFSRKADKEAPLQSQLCVVSN